MGKLFKVSMFITSFIPLWITILFQDFLNLYRTTSYIWTELLGILSIFIVNTIATVVILKSIQSIKFSEYKPYQVVDVKLDSGVTTNIVLTYIVPLFIFDFTRWDSVVYFMVYFLALMVNCTSNSIVYANILFELFHYKFYSCELQWKPEPTVNSIQVLVLSKDNLHARKGNTIDVVRLNSSLYFNK